MLNQSFSADNFRKIFDYQNRKGINLESDFFPEVETITSQLKDIKVKFKSLKKSKSNYTIEKYEEIINKLKVEKDKLAKKKEKTLTRELEKVSKEVNSSSLSFPLKKTTNLGKPLYTIEKKATAYFATKQVQYNIKRLYQVQQSNRNEIISQLKEILDDTYPKIVVRADIEEFYESISHTQLFDLLNIESLLTLSSKKIVKQIVTTQRNESY